MTRFTAREMNRAMKQLEKTHTLEEIRAMSRHEYNEALYRLIAEYKTDHQEKSMLFKGEHNG